MKKHIEKYNEEIYKQDINLNIKNTKKKNQTSRD